MFLNEWLLLYVRYKLIKYLQNKPPKNKKYFFFKYLYESKFPQLS